MWKERKNDEDITAVCMFVSVYIYKVYACGGILVVVIVVVRIVGDDGGGGGGGRWRASYE